jgi:hypothetical protein
LIVKAVVTLLLMINPKARRQPLEGLVGYAFGAHF